MFTKPSPATSISNTAAPEPELELREITRDADDKLKALLIHKEKVHPVAPTGGKTPIEEFSEKRLGPADNGTKIWDKHCYGLFEKGKKEPKIVVYVKLLHIEHDKGGAVANAMLPGNVLEILKSPVQPIENPNTAIFYTISSVSERKNQARALVPAGAKKPAESIVVLPPRISTGEILIGKVAAHLKQKYHITTLSTLSPMRSGLGKQAKGFAQWLDRRFSNVGHINTLPVFTNEEMNALAHLAGDEASREPDAQLAAKKNLDHLRRVPNLGTEAHAFLTTLMENLGIYYIAHEKKPQHTKPMDDVTGFHIGNGAVLANIHYLPDRATKADMVGALGLMANYRYIPEHLDRRKANYMQSGAVRLSPELAERYYARLQQLGEPVPEYRGAPLKPVVNHDAQKPVTQVMQPVIRVHDLFAIPAQSPKPSVVPGR